MQKDKDEFGYDPTPLNKKIQDDIGIDVSQYRSQELFLTLSEMIVFIEYIGTWVIPPVIITFIIYIVGFFLLGISTWQYLTYGFFGLVLAIVSGLLIGIFLLTIKLKYDIATITTQSLGIMGNMVKDADKVKRENPDRSQKEIFNLLFEGVMMVVMLPTTIAVMRERVPFGLRFLDSTIVKSFRMISKKVNFSKIDTSRGQSLSVADAPNSLSAKFGVLLPKIEANILGVVNTAIAIARIPLALSTICVSLLIWLLLYLLM